MSETLEIFGREYTGVTGIKAKDDNGNLVTFIKPEGTLNVSQNGTVDVSQYASANVYVPGGGGGSLPNDYQEVEYLTTDSSVYTYVFFPHAFQSGDIIAFSAERSDWNVSANRGTMCGIKLSISDATGSRFAIGMYNQKKRIFASSGNTISDTQDQTGVSSNGTAKVYGNDIGSGKVTWSLELTTAIDRAYILFYGSYALDSYCLNCNLYAFVVTTASGNTSMNLRPCYRKADSVCGFYDLVTSRFITAYTGTLTAGPDVR